jgi:hypothetical protein
MTIQEHPLAWRWTDPKYAEFPPDILAQIHPLEPKTAALVHDRWSCCFRKRGIISEQFLFRETCNTEGNLNDDVSGQDTSSSEKVTAWLRSREPNIALPVTISWQRDCAVRTAWGILTQRWDDFFYPSSDNAFIVPDELNWLLAFDHEGSFDFFEKASL